MTGNTCAFAICPAALRLRGPTRAYPDNAYAVLPEIALARTCREQRLRGLPEQCFCRSGQASAATRRKPAQSLNHFISAPDEVLTAGNACAFAICPAALRLHGPTGTALARACREQRLRGPAGTALARACREQRLRGLPKQRFCRSGQASAATRRGGVANRRDG